MNYLFHAKTEYFYGLAVKYEFTGTDIIIYIQHDNYRRISSCVGLLLQDLLKHVEGMFYYSKLELSLLTLIKKTRLYMPFFRELL